MYITRLRPDIKPSLVTTALRDLNPEKIGSNRFAVVTVKGEGDTKHAFLLEAKSWIDKDLNLLASATGDKLISLSVKEADGTTHIVTGNVESNVALTDASLSKISDVTAATGCIMACLAGTVAALVGFAEGVSVLKSMHPVVSGALGLVVAFGGAMSFGRLVKRTDGADWALQTVALAKDGEHAEAEIKSVENAPPKMVALPPPNAHVRFVIPMDVIKQTVAV